MTTVEVEMLINLVTKLVESSGKSWSEKKAFVMENASDDDKTNLNEFGSWFDE